MSAEIYKHIAAYQNGDSDAALALVEKFKPLIKRYTFFLHREDGFEDLQCYLLSMLKTWDTRRLSSTDDGTMIRYIANSVRNEFIAISKQKEKEQHVSFIEDVAVPQAIEYEQKTSTRDQYDQLIIHDLRKILNENELEIIYALYFGQQTVSEIAQRKSKTRQAVNQTKIKALQKLKAAWGKDRSTTSSQGCA